MTKVGHTPLRRCVVCRKRRRKDELIRLVCTEAGDVAVDVEHRAPGRGTYLCGDGCCLRTGLRAKVMSNAFKRRVVIGGKVGKSIESIFQGV